MTQNVYVVGGSVSLGTLISGEETVAGTTVLATIKAGYEYQIVRPAGTGAAATTWANSEVALGSGGGAAGDYLQSLEISNADALNAAVYLEDGNAAAVVATNSVSGTGGTNPTAISTYSLTPTAAITAAVNQFAGYILSVTYTPTTGVSTKILRKVVSHPVWAAVSGAGSLVFTVSHVVPAGATITAWELLPVATAYEVQPFNTPAGVRKIDIDRKSTLGAWRLSVDATAQVVANGIFT